MSDTEETYCRLCAEPTPIEQLISSNEDVAISSKIATKLLWINIDISTNNTLPTTICFACYDQLERTWNFLHNVRSAQEKLWGIFGENVDDKNVEVNCDIKSESIEKAGRPVDKDWQEFQNTKTEVKIDPEENYSVAELVDPSSLLNLAVPIKSEHGSDDELPNNDSDFQTTDSDLPLQRTAKKRRSKKKKKVRFDPEISIEDLFSRNEKEVVPLDISTLNFSWENYMCRCASCDALCKNISSLRLHAIEIHACCCTFKCSDCGKVIGNFKSFVTHVRSHQNALRYCCEYCNKQFNLTSYVRKHLNTDHENYPLLTCQNCGAYFENDELLQDHLIMYSKGIKKGRKKEPIDPSCELKCELCNKEFKSRSNLQQHKSVHLERSRDFACHVCGKMFFTKGTLSTHMGTHEDTKPFKCEFCPLAFRARGNLQSHVSLHSGAKPFVCEQCGKSFRVKRHLKSHSIVHTDLMPYLCQYCNKSFRFKTRLNLHLRQHTGAKPYTCCYCQRDFTNGSNYKKHMKRRHNVDTSKRKYSNIIDSNIENSEDRNESV